jgi:nitroimidazol reductase NimA-like FMN-containing flavoprotein (pyridoxamine 5'-phosphate oxidase superfamily)/GNAT superfamily N-acetyltransferase
MRREIFRMPREEAVGLFRGAEMVHLSCSGEDGQPILRTVNAVVVDGAVAFHGSLAGEKTEAIGRAAVVGCEELVATIPSWFTDPERACPATAFYRSAQAHGVLERVDDPVHKARVLQALMERFQPEGRHVPITADHPLYRGEVKGVLVLRVSLDRLDGKAKLGQNRKPEELSAILAGLWKRGEPGDPRVIELLRAANPNIPSPAFLSAPEGLALHCALGEADLPGALSLLEGQYWNEGVPLTAMGKALLGASAWVGAKDREGKLVAMARALSDGAKCAWIYDVVVDPAWRGRGVGQAVVRLVLDHPRVRGARQVELDTRDAEGLYARFGFAPAPPRNLRMMLRRSGG